MSDELERDGGPTLLGYYAAYSVATTEVLGQPFGPGTDNSTFFLADHKLRITSM